MKRAVAKELNLAFYNTGKPCKKGHFSYRYTKSSHCIECVKIQTTEWRLENPEKHSLSMRKWLENNRELHGLRVKRWQNANKEKVKLNRKAWEKANPARVTAKSTKRVLAKINRTPAWLTEQQRQSITTEYELAAWCTKVTGIKYHVDHIVPLQGKTVSGLHVPWNLQVIPATDNLIKSNKFSDKEASL